jgi:hypothetical protein
MERPKSATLLTQARDSFAEISLNFGEVASALEDVIEIDQTGSGEYRVRVRLIRDPINPVLSIERFPKPNLASQLIGEPEFMPKQGYSHKTRKFEAIADTTFGWLDKSNDGRVFSSGDIVQIIKQLL